MTWRHTNLFARRPRFVNAACNVRRVASWVAMVWFTTWIVAALTPAIGVHDARGTAMVSTPAATGIVLAQYSVETPDGQCLDGAAMDGVGRFLEVVNITAPAAQGSLNSELLRVNNADSGQRPRTCAMAVQTMPLQGHMTRLRI